MHKKPYNHVNSEKPDHLDVRWPCYVKSFSIQLQCFKTNGAGTERPFLKKQTVHRSNRLLQQLELEWDVAVSDNPCKNVNRKVYWVPQTLTATNPWHQEEHLTISAIFSSVQWQMVELTTAEEMDFRNKCLKKLTVKVSFIYFYRNTFVSLTLWCSVVPYMATTRLAVFGGSLRIALLRCCIRTFIAIVLKISCIRQHGMFSSMGLVILDYRESIN